MKLKNTLATLTGAVLIAGALFSGAALAAGGDTTVAPTTSTQQSDAMAKRTDWISQLSEGGQATWKQLTDLRQSHMEKLKSESEALVNQAMADGTITQEQADKLLSHGGKPGGKHGGMHGGPGRGGKGGPGTDRLGQTQEEVQAHLDRHVQEGKLTQAQADQMLQKWLEAQTK